MRRAARIERAARVGKKGIAIDEMEAAERGLVWWERAPVVGAAIIIIIS